MGASELHIQSKMRICTAVAGSPVGLLTLRQMLSASADNGVAT